MAKKAVTRKDKKIEELTDQLQNNVIAIQSGPSRRNWSTHDLKAIKPINFPQKSMFSSYFSGNNIIANGSAGTGKTFCAIYLALTDVLSKEQPQKKLIIVRSAVPSREIGHLPGDIMEKLEPYERPYKDIFSSVVNYRNAYDEMKLHGVVDFMPTSYVRGLTWDNAVVVIDEVQNLNFHEINSIITRIGDNSKLIVVGDQIQSDLYNKKNDSSGMKRFLQISKKIDSFDEIVFTKDDIVRSKFVKEWITAMEDTPE